MKHRIPIYRFNEDTVKNVVENTNIIFALVLAYATTETLRLNELRKSAHYRHIFKKRVNEAIQQRELLNSQLSTLLTVEDLDIIDIAADDLDKALRVHEEKLYYSLTNYYHSMHRDEAAIHAHLDTCGIVTGLLVNFLEDVHKAFFRQTGMKFRSQICLEPLRCSLAKLAATYYGHARNVSRANIPKEIKDAATIIYKTLSKEILSLKHFKSDRVT